MRKQWLYAPAVLAVVAIINFTSGGVAHAGAQTCTWTGAGTNTNWSTAANWSCNTGTVPADGGAVVLNTGGLSITAVNDLATTNTYTGISIATSSTGGYRLTGNALRVAGDIKSAANVWLVIDNDLTMTANSTITASIQSPTFNFGSNNLVIDGTSFSNVAINGSGSISMMNNATIIGNSPNFTGTITINSGVSTISASSLGAGVTVNNGASFTMASASSDPLKCSLPTYDLTQATAPITLIGTPYTYTSGTYTQTYEKLTVGGSVGGCGGTVDEYYVGNIAVGDTFTLSSPITVQNANVNIASLYNTLNITGAINATGYTLSSAVKNTGSIVINASSNNSLTPNGTYASVTQQVTLSDANSSASVAIGAPYRVCINGSRGSVTMFSGGILCGTGTVGAIYYQSGGHIAPGNSPGVLNSGDVTLGANTSLDIELGGTAAGEYDQLNVTGTVDLAGATLNTILYNGYTPALNSTYTIINNDGTDAITGTFAGLAQGASFTVGGYTFTISYSGGTGNDVVLTTTAVPAPPNTAGVLARPVNVIIAALVVATGIGVMIVRRAILKKSSRR